MDREPWRGCRSTWTSCTTRTFGSGVGEIVEDQRGVFLEDTIEDQGEYLSATSDFAKKVKNKVKTDAKSPRIKCQTSLVEDRKTMDGGRLGAGGAALQRRGPAYSVPRAFSTPNVQGPTDPYRVFSSSVSDRGRE